MDTTPVYDTCLEKLTLGLPPTLKLPSIFAPSKESIHLETLLNY